MVLPKGDCNAGTNGGSEKGLNGKSEDVPEDVDEKLESGHVIAVLGSGGREHALCWKLSQSPQVSAVLAIPGNAGTSKCPKVSNVNVNTDDFPAFVVWLRNNVVKVVIVGPEAYLVDGMSDKLWANGFPCFGPYQVAAAIESDKDWAKEFMDKYHIPTARWKSFHDADEAKEFVKSNPYKGGVVVKAIGLAGGKGVVVANTNEEAFEAIDNMLVNKCFGDAGRVIIIEERLVGEEVSVLAFTDGDTVRMMLPAQDHKRLKDNDEGPNTGGMGAYCPFDLSEEELLFVEQEIMQRAVLHLKQERTPFVGVLYAGLMITDDGIFVLEFNCRFGDPETQVLMPLLRTDLYEIIMACCYTTLHEIEVEWNREKSCVGVVMSCEGYPDAPPKPTVVSGLSDDVSDVLIFHGKTKLDGKSVIATGGRAFNVVAIDDNLMKASAKATSSCAKIKFDGAHYRRDIGRKGVARHLLRNGQATYEAAGVNIAAGNELIRNMKEQIESTFGDGGISPIGSFGAVLDFRLKADYTDPALVSGCDGVGTKLKIAQEMRNHETIGQDLVAMCVNDILAHGAKPLFFLDYFSCGRLEFEIAEDVISSIVRGCRLAECALVGGETAEMPGFYKDGEYDLAGFAVGIVEKHLMLPTTILPNDKVIYLPSSGLHSNGFSLIRKIIKDRFIDLHSVAPFSHERRSYGQEFLKPTKIYTKEILPLAKKRSIKAFAHITGGGLLENVGRVLPDNLKVDLDATQWNILPVFGWIAVSGSIGEEEMLRTFNCGVGGVVIVDPEKADEVAEFLHSNVIGTVVTKESDDEPQVSIRNFAKSLIKTMEPFVPLYMSPEYTNYKRVAVLISGVGSNLRALIEKTISDPHSAAKIVLVISSRDLVGGLEIAEEFGIPSRVISRIRNAPMDKNDEPVVKLLEQEKIDIVCLAGYMHILGKAFVQKFRGRMLNVHPSLLPAFRGLRPQYQALQAGVTVSGCTIHFVEPEVDSGGIIEQSTVPVYKDDTEEALTSRIKEREHEIYPRALKMLAAGKIALDENTGKVIRH